eukprot:COSAG02_NODE_41278_length_396_cov_0.723906_1_plen_63_part_10
MTDANQLIKTLPGSTVVSVRLNDFSEIGKQLADINPSMNGYTQSPVWRQASFDRYQAYTLLPM